MRTTTAKKAAAAKKSQKKRKFKSTVKKFKYKSKAPQIALPPAAGDLSLHERINYMISLATINSAISRQHNTVYNYCKTWNITEAEMSRFLHKKIPITLKMLLKHCDHLGIVVQVILTKG